MQAFGFALVGASVRPGCRAGKFASLTDGLRGASWELPLDGGGRRKLRKFPPTAATRYRGNDTTQSGQRDERRICKQTSLTIATDNGEATSFILIAHTRRVFLEPRCHMSNWTTTTVFFAARNEQSRSSRRWRCLLAQTPNPAPATVTGPPVTGS